MLCESNGHAIIRLLVVIVSCLLFSSCTKHQSLQQKNNVDHALINTQKNIFDTITQQEAMLIDVPIPLYDERIIPSNYTAESDTLVFGYKSPLSHTQAIEFFMNQMERYGWKHLVSFEGEESLLQFEGPDRYCTVIIKNVANSSSARIFIYIKKGELVSSP